MGTNINSESLNAMQQVDIRTVDKSALIDLNSVRLTNRFPYQRELLHLSAKSETPIVFE